MNPINPLFYKSIVALNRQKHRAFKYDHNACYLFARQANSVPLGVSEFGSASRFYPIVFLMQNDIASPIAVLGTQTKQNVWVDSEGNWSYGYVPAYVRRYPFISVRTSETETTLCVDEASGHLTGNGAGDLLFDADGNETEFLTNKLQFAEAYETEFKRNQLFSTLLQELDLLEPAQLNERSEEVKAVLSGFMVVSKKRLDNLDKDSLAKLHAAGALELIYQHLFSLHRFDELAAKSLCEQQKLAEGAA